MKIPVIRHFSSRLEMDQLQAALEVLESFSDARGVSDTEMDVVGELITNICGAMEVKQMIAEGKRDSEALNAFAQKVMGAIDK